MRVLLTGANGFLGAATRVALEARGVEVVGSGRDPSSDVGADLTSPSGAAELLGAVRPDRVLHLAWTVDDRIDGLSNIDWLGHTARLLRSCIEADVSRIVTVGTCFEYGVTGEPGPTTPATVYGAAKHGVRATLDGLVAAGLVGGAHARVFYVYGPGEEEPRLLPAVGRGLLRGATVPTTDGTQRRDYLYIDDIGSALATLVTADASGTYDVASGTAIPVASILRGLADRIPGGRVDLGAIDRRAGDPDVIEGDPSALRGLGWEPTTTLEDGLDRSVEWLTQTQVQEMDT